MHAAAAQGKIKSPSALDGLGHTPQPWHMEPPTLAPSARPRPACVVVGMCTFDTFLESEPSQGFNEEVLVVVGETSRRGGKGYLAAKSFLAASKGSIDLIAEIAAHASKFADARVNGLIQSLD